MGMPAEAVGGPQAPPEGGGSQSSFEHRGGYQPPGGGQSPPVQQQPSTQQSPVQGVPSTGQQASQAPAHPIDAFLNGIPAIQRQLVDPLLTQFRPQFDQMHTELEAYKQAGMDPQQVQQAAQIWQMLENDPQTLYNLLKAEFEPQAPQQQPQQYQQPIPYGQQYGQASPPVQIPQNPQFDQWGRPIQAPQQYGQQPQPYQQQTQPGQYGQQQGPMDPMYAQLMAQQQQQQQMLGAMGQFLVTQHQAQRQAQEDAVLNNALSDARTRLGNFNEDFVLLQMEKGKSVDDAVKAWHGVLQGQANAAGQPGGTVTPLNPTPPVLAGGSVPNGHVEAKNLSSKDTRDLVVQFLSKPQGG